MTDGYIYGSGAQGRVTLDILRLQYPEVIWNFLDDNPEKWNQKINGAKILGNLEFLTNKSNILLHIALGKPAAKAHLTRRCEDLNLNLINAIHPSANILPTAKIGVGVFIGAGVIINTDATIQKGAIINTAAIIEHDTEIGEFVNVSPAVCVGGRVKIGTMTFIGSGSIILARTEIGSNSVIGMGSIVNRNIPNNKMAFGLPAKIIKEINNNTDWSKIL